MDVNVVMEKLTDAGVYSDSDSIASVVEAVRLGVSSANPTADELHAALQDSNKFLELFSAGITKAPRTTKMRRWFVRFIPHQLKNSEQFPFDEYFEECEKTDGTKFTIFGGLFSLFFHDFGGTSADAYCRMEKLSSAKEITIPSHRGKQNMGWSILCEMSGVPAEKDYQALCKALCEEHSTYIVQLLNPDKEVVGVCCSPLDYEDPFSTITEFPERSAFYRKAWDTTNPNYDETQEHKAWLEAKDEFKWKDGWSDEVFLQSVLGETSGSSGLSKMKLE